MRHIINLSPVPTTETWQETLKAKKGYYDPKKINKRRKVYTRAKG